MAGPALGTLRLRTAAGALVPLPDEGTLLFLPGAFLQASESELAHVGDCVVVLPDAPPVVAAWPAVQRFNVLHDDRPRAAVAQALGVPEGGARVRVEAGMIVEVIALVGQGASPPQRPPVLLPTDAPPAGLFGGWAPGIAATAAWVVFSSLLVRFYAGGE